LNDSAGKVTIIHVTQFENPVCLECESQMREQINELKLLADANDQNISIITLNIRKNEYSDDGWRLAEEWYDINITWHWVEEFEPFQISSQYQKYWEVDGSFSNPSIILIDPDLNVVGVYHVYCIGSGELDGVRTADSLSADVGDIISGQWGDEFKGDISTGVSFSSMFLLGIITSFSPCSILLLLTMISYIGSMKDETINGSSRVDWEKGLWIGISFTLGMTLVFLLFGLLISYVGLFIEMSDTFYLIAGMILVILGINAIKPFGDMLARLKSMNKKDIDHSGTGEVEADRPLEANGGAEVDGEMEVDNRFTGRRFIERLGKRSANLASFFLGILFSIGWAPCAISLVFPVVVLMLTQDFSILMGGLLMATFGLGHGMVIIPFCVASGEMKGKIGNRYMSAGKRIQFIFGLAIILIGMIFASRYYGVYLW
ncbi:MAG: cytochrome c biogenesis protein CcdA, partial [Thermoplasmata archaeon]|nr:cytochrome c biogenesis protein CcdA [Thermoplasmata archaeon]